MDGRRRQWVTWDVYFNDGALGRALRDEFGIAGLVVFNGFICACKKSSVQGRMSYTTDTGALATMGLPELRLVNEQGQEWKLDELWAFLARKKQISRKRHGGITDVISTGWNKWQKPPRKGAEDPADTSATPDGRANNGSGHLTDAQATHDGREETSRSDPRITTTIEKNANDYGPQFRGDIDIDPDIDLDPDLDVDNDLDLDAPPLASEPAAATDDEPPDEDRPESQSGGESQLRGLVERIEALCTGDRRDTVRSEATWLVAGAMQHGHLEVLADALDWSAGRPTPPVMPRALAEPYKRICRERGLPAPMFNVANLVKRAS